MKTEQLNQIYIHMVVNITNFLPQIAFIQSLEIT